MNLFGLAFSGGGIRSALRIVRDGQFLDQDVSGVPKAFLDSRPAGLMNVAVHPKDDSWY